MIDVDAMLKERFQNSGETNKPLVKAAASVLKKLVHQIEINRFIETHQHLEGLEFNDAVLDHFNPLNNLFLWENKNSKNAHHQVSLDQAIKALENEQAVILFPTDEVSRICPAGNRDGKRNRDFLSLAKKQMYRLFRCISMAKLCTFL